MNKGVLKAFSIFLLVALLSGCFFTIHAGNGGDVLSSSGSRDCLEGQNCVFEITNFTFDETFMAIPLPGFEFVKWSEGVPGEGFLCGGSTIPQCTVDNTGLGSDPRAQALVASDEDFRIAAVFRPKDGFLGLTTASYSGTTSYMGMSKACYDQYGNGARLCNAEDILTSNPPPVISASLVWIKPKPVVGAGASSYIDYSGSTLPSDLGCNLSNSTALDRAAFQSAGRTSVVNCSIGLKAACCR